MIVAMFLLPLKMEMDDSVTFWGTWPESVWLLGCIMTSQLSFSISAILLPLGGVVICDKGNDITTVNLVYTYSKGYVCEGLCA